ncbi:HNH endonuclease [Haloplanus natans]|uniref:HNH endonuclease n=1 Tax=Haloplanus natans TaxID=376171 RepID=UPI0006782298|nr:HNH endonuclease [Haloplanus natans]
MNRNKREAVIERDQGQCVNCGASGPDTTLDVHHIVPRGRGGSDRLSNLALLCRQCHDAAHDEATAPTVQFSSTGQMRSDSFKTYLRFFSELPTARFDAKEKVWRIPKADFERVVQSIDAPQESTAVTDGGGA